MTTPRHNNAVPQESLWLAEIWQENRERLTHTLEGKIPEQLKRRLGVEDVVQEAYLACGRRLDYLREPGNVPVYVKIWRIALQTLTDIVRKHLGAGKRDAMKEVELATTNPDGTDHTDAWAQFADTISSPRTHLERIERQAIIRRVLANLQPNDREILTLRHFEELSNAECAAVLEITQKTASIRYTRALERFRDLLLREEEHL